VYKYGYQSGIATAFICIVKYMYMYINIWRNDNDTLFSILHFSGSSFEFVRRYKDKSLLNHRIYERQKLVFLLKGKLRLRHIKDEKYD